MVEPYGASVTAVSDHANHSVTLDTINKVEVDSQVSDTPDHLENNSKSNINSSDPSPAIPKETLLNSKKPIHMPKPTRVASFGIDQKINAMDYLESGHYKNNNSNSNNNNGETEWMNHLPDLGSISPGSSSVTGSHYSAVFSEPAHRDELDGYEEYEDECDGNLTPTSTTFSPQAFVPAQSTPLGNYGTPEMPRGSSKLPHLPLNYLQQPRAQGKRGARGNAKQLPRAEKLPPTGYELLASTLAACHGEEGYMAPRPMYRRFAALNYRLLLHLQDELAELEEQLHRLDTADTQTRREGNHILPASRRGEALSGGELQWHRTDTLGKIGFKLHQYNNVLGSFQSTHGMFKPSQADVEKYRQYLASVEPIVATEACFLDKAEDLVSFEANSKFHTATTDDKTLTGGQNRPGAAAAAAAAAELLIADSDQELDSVMLRQTPGLVTAMIAVMTCIGLAMAGLHKLLVVLMFVVGIGIGRLWSWNWRWKWHSQCLAAAAAAG